MDKQAQWAGKALEAVRRAGSQTANSVKNIPQLQQLNAALARNPKLKAMLTNSLIGAGVGAGTLGLTRMMTPQDEDQPRGVMGQAMLGAVLGGTAGAGFTGMRQLLRTPKPDPVPPPRKLTDAIGQAATQSSNAAVDTLAGNLGAGIGGFVAGAPVAGVALKRGLRHGNPVIDRLSRLALTDNGTGNAAKRLLAQFDKDVASKAMPRGSFGHAVGATVPRGRVAQRLQRSLPHSKAMTSLNKALRGDAHLQTAVKGTRAGVSPATIAGSVAGGALFGRGVQSYLEGKDVYNPSWRPGVNDTQRIWQPWTDMTTHRRAMPRPPQPLASNTSGWGNLAHGAR